MLISRGTGAGDRWLIAQTSLAGWRWGLWGNLFWFRNAEVNRIRVSMIQLWKLSEANAMLPLVHRSPFRCVFLVFVLLLRAAVGTVGAAVPTPTPTPTPTPGQLTPLSSPLPGTNDAVNAVIPQPDGKVIAAGRFTFANGVAPNRIARFNSQWLARHQLRSWQRARTGKLPLPFFKPDGRIVVVRRFTSFNGFTHNRVCRLNANGSVDQTFGLGNGINTAALALALQSDGRIIVGGEFYPGRSDDAEQSCPVNTDGSVDLSFDPAPERTTTSTQSSFNRIVVLSLAAPLSATMVFPVGELRGDRELARSILSFDLGVGTGETFSRWHCNITARSFSAVASCRTSGTQSHLYCARFRGRLALFRIQSCARQLGLFVCGRTRRRRSCWRFLHRL